MQDINKSKIKIKMRSGIRMGAVATMCQFFAIQLQIGFIRCIVVASAFLSLSTTQAFWFDEPLADVTRESVNMHQGDTLVINCTLTQHYAGKLNASHMYFTHEETHPKPLPENYHEVVNSKTAMLKIPGTSQRDKGFYNCMLNQTTLNKNHTRLGYVEFTGFLPDEVTSMTCVSDDFEDMTCTWCPDVVTDWTVWTLTWSAGGCEDVKCVHYPDLARTCNCFFNATTIPSISTCDGDEFFRNTTYNMIVTSYTDEGSIQSKLMITTGINMVKPSAIDGMRVSALGPSRISVSWTIHPLTERGYPIVYQIIVSSEHDETQIVKTDQGVTSVVIKGLQPDTQYNVTAQCRPLMGKYWSDAVTKSVTTSLSNQEEKRLLKMLRNICDQI